MVHLTGRIIVFAFLFLSLAFPAASLAAGWETAAPGVLLYKAAAVAPSGGSMNVWMYLPAKRKGKIPCVFIAPAGSRLFHGMTLGSGDQAEHFPLVQAGFAVVAYDIDGPCEADSGPQVGAAARAFRNADGGVANAKIAISKALKDLADIDPNRLYVSGHSSAGTLALQVAAKDKRVKGCVAFAPCVDLVGQLSSGMSMLNAMAPGFGAFSAANSPDHLVKSISCPVFLFHADDDTTIPTAQIQALAEALKKNGTDVNFVRVANGGHYDSMTAQGIPSAIQWLNKKAGSAANSVPAGKSPAPVKN